MVQQRCLWGIIAVAFSNGTSSFSPPCFVCDTTHRCLKRTGGLRLGSDYTSSDAVGSRSSYSANNLLDRDYFISDAQIVHLGPAARILTEEFYGHRTNFVTFQIERLKTVLSLESTFPNNQQKFQNEFSRRRTLPLQHMIVACSSKNGQVVGFAEVDARPLSVTGKNGGLENEVVLDANSAVISEDNILRSYMYNLAVDKQWKRKGIASALVRSCEQFVMDMHDICVEKRLYLRVRKTNHAAIALYESLGYREMLPEVIQLSKEDINSGSLEDDELILFAKDLPMAEQCSLD